MTADQYPYIASSTRLAAMVVPDWALQGTTADFVRIAADPDRGRKLRDGIQQQLDERDGGASIRIARYPPRPDWAGPRPRHDRQARGYDSARGRARHPAPRRRRRSASA